jgi:hypothetical protein
MPPKMRALGLLCTEMDRMAKQPDERWLNSPHRPGMSEVEVIKYVRQEGARA